MRTLKYETRDGAGKDIVKYIEVKEFPVKDCPEVDCPVCGRKITKGVAVKDAVSSNFTDWNYFKNPIVCEKCAALFSVYPYSYVYTPDDGNIRLLNIRQIEDAICRLSDDIKRGKMGAKFLMCISTSQKKHLFYKAKMNYTPGLDCFTQIAINLEEETIYTTLERQGYLFKFIESLQVLGTSKSAAAHGEISFKTAQKLKKAGLSLEAVYELLQKELTESREIQLALYASQQPVPEKNIIEMHEDTAFYMINLFLKSGGDLTKL